MWVGVDAERECYLTCTLGANTKEHPNDPIGQVHNFGLKEFPVIEAHIQGMKDLSAPAVDHLWFLFCNS